MLFKFRMARLLIKSSHLKSNQIISISEEQNIKLRLTNKKLYQLQHQQFIDNNMNNQQTDKWADEQEVDR